MNKETKNELYAKAKEMMINGESWDKIMSETTLRQKDLKRIQMTEINPKF